MTGRSRHVRDNAAEPSSCRRETPVGAASNTLMGFPVVGVGASAGGLQAFRKFLDALPPDSGMAYVLVQHLDPTHESLMVELLGAHTTMTMRQAAEGMRIERNAVYVIPPGFYLSIKDGALHLTKPREHHGARLPFDFLLRSLAEEFGDWAAAVILSGSGTDGSIGLKAVKERCGIVIAQAPDEAGHDGMPRSAIKTGAVDLVLPVAEIPEALIGYDRRMTRTRGSEAKDTGRTWLPEIIELLHANTPHDFTHYKPGTLRRRIERRMAMAAIEAEDVDRYLEALRNDPSELERLAKDLLINVTSFFRDPQVFDLLAEKVIPDLVGGATADHPVRIWIAGCSTGEETYSLAMLFRERIAVARRNVKLQVFASDIDPDAVAIAREGLYPEAIAADVSPERLARFFAKEDHGYRISPELRGAVVFTVQDVLADPPFSRLDLISCRNLLIYLQPDAQAKVVALFHFALREGGMLLLGSSETIGANDDRFEAISKSARLYRHVARSRPGDLGHVLNAGGGVRVPERPGQGRTAPRQASLADLCRRLVLDAYAPAAILINRNHECLYTLGPTDRYLRVVPGRPTHDVFAMARDEVRAKLRSAVQQAEQENVRVEVTGGRMGGDNEFAFNLSVQPVRNDGEDLLLICFVDEPARGSKVPRPVAPRDASRVAELERELEATRRELLGAIRNLEIASEAQMSINDEALSINEEYQATNEELLTSKEELQSLNEELAALNNQLQETLERQRTTANDLQNVLFSTNVATIFLDPDLRIRFFTPATGSLFNVIPGDVGRPIADLSLLAAGGTLLADARTVLDTLAPIDRETEIHDHAWFIRRIMPYRALDNRVEGVVVTFTDITERKRTRDALEEAKRLAETANAAKSRFLAVASHDLRQPLQTLVLLQGLLAKVVESEKARDLLERIDATVASMSGMLNTLLDINRIDTGTIHAEKFDFPINGLLDRLRSEFTYHAEARGLVLRVVPCGQSVYSDPPLLEQMIRNILANALKFTPSGAVLLGCRRRGKTLSVEVWDTGVGIPEGDLRAIFEEYRQLDNAVGERSQGLGLGLSIVQRLGDLLGHGVRVVSRPGKGSAFAIDVGLAPSEPEARREPIRHRMEDGVADGIHRRGEILVVEDEAEVCDLLELLLQGEGHGTAAAPDGVAALEAVTRGTIRPDLILADYNLPNGPTGTQLIARLREKLHRQIPAIILTGDISTGALNDIALLNCLYLNKPVKPDELTRAIQRLLAIAPIEPPAPRAETVGGNMDPVIFIVDDDRHVLEGLRGALEEEGRTVETYSSCEAFLEAFRPGREACLVVDAYLPGMSGLELLRELKGAGHRLPAVMITGASDVPMAVEAMKAGAMDFIEKPVGPDELRTSVANALGYSKDAATLAAWREDAANCVARLTPRQRQIMELVLAGHPSKNIAADLGISQRTVENHRASIMKKTGSKSLPALARLAVSAAAKGADQADI